MGKKATTRDFKVGGVDVIQFTAANNFVTDATDWTKFNQSWIVYCFIDNNTTGSPVVTLQSSPDGNNWVDYKEDSVNVPLPNSYIDGEYLPRYFRISYTSNGSDGTVTFKLDTVTND